MEVKKLIQPLQEVNVSDAVTVELTVVVGNHKMGGSLVRFTDDLKVIGQGEIDQLSLGTGAAIKGRTLAVTTNILDSNTAPDIIASHQFSNAKPATFSLKDKVANAGDVFSWETTYLFK